MQKTSLPKFPRKTLIAALVVVTFVFILLHQFFGERGKPAVMLNAALALKGFLLQGSIQGISFMGNLADLLIFLGDDPGAFFLEIAVAG